MELKTMDDLVATVSSGKKKKRMAVVAANDPHCLEAVVMAVEQNIVEPILIGDRKEIISSMEEIGCTCEMEIHDVPEAANMAVSAVQMVRSGEVDFIMKGKINSSDLLRPVVHKETGLGTGSTISHLSVIQLPEYHKLIGLTDCAMNIQPNLEQKTAITKNAVNALIKMGYEQPKVAMLCANEEVTEKQPDTVDARAIQTLCEQGDLGNCVACGPISFDIAMDAAAAAYKGFGNPVAGNPDILLVPNLVTGNVLNKALKQFGHSVACGAVIGARCPIVLT